MKLLTNLSSKMKKCLIVSLVLIILGMVFFFFPGINKTVDYTGGTYLSVELGSDLTEENYKENLNEIKDVLKNNGIKTIGYDALEGNYTKTSIVIKYKDAKNVDMESVNATIKSQLEEHFTNKDYLVEISYYKLNKAQSVNNYLAILILSLSLIVAAFVYMGLRYRWLAACSMIIGLIHDVLLTIAITTIISFTGLYLFDENFIVIIVGVAFYSIFNSMMLFDKVRNNIKRETLKNSDYFKIAEISLNDDLTRFTVVNIVALIFLLIFGIVGITTVGSLAVPAIIGVLASSYGCLFIALPLWAAFNSKIKRDKLKAAELKAKSDAEDNEM